MSDSLPVKLTGAGVGVGAGEVIGPALCNAIGNVAFKVRYESYREFRQTLAAQLGI